MLGPITTDQGESGEASLKCEDFYGNTGSLWLPNTQLMKRLCKNAMASHVVAVYLGVDLFMLGRCSWIGDATKFSNASRISLTPWRWNKQFVQNA